MLRNLLKRVTVEAYRLPLCVIMFYIDRDKLVLTRKESGVYEIQLKDTVHWRSLKVNKKFIN